jgi:murein DD-endopeptidase MepM/ murein hydrolase activator NlpD
MNAADPGPGEEPPRLSLRFRPGGSRTEFSRVWEGRELRRLVLVVGLSIALAVVLAGSWWLLAARAHESTRLRATVAALEEERTRVVELARALEEVEEAYGRLVQLFAPGQARPEGLWLPPAGASPPVATEGRPPPDDDPEAWVDGPPPSAWPLTERGFLTQPLLAPGPDEQEPGHPGIDIAVPSGSYFRSVGPGRVVDRGEDPTYGLFIVVEHPGRFRSLYAHASVLVAEVGRFVHEGEVLGLTGSSGRSTAPHLHLEITRNGAWLDPLALLQRP